MRIAGLIGLLLALAVVGLLAKKQLTPTALPTLPVVPGLASSAASGVSAPDAPTSVRQQSQLLQQQIKQSVEAGLLSRVPPDDAK